MRLFLDDPLLGDCPSSESDPFPFILRLRDDLEAFLLPTLEPEEDNDLDRLFDPDRDLERDLDPTEEREFDLGDLDLEREPDLERELARDPDLERDLDLEIDLE